MSLYFTYYIITAYFSASSTICLGMTVEDFTVGKVGKFKGMIRNEVGSYSLL